MKPTALNHTPEEFEEAKELFLAATLAEVEYYKRRLGLTYFKYYKVILSEGGKKYARILKQEMEEDGNERPNGRTLIGFLDLTNGDILKAASWKAPAKHPRGNIFSQANGREAYQQGHVRYL